MNPVPDNATCCGLSLLLSAIEMIAVLEPFADGLNVTLMSHVAEAATLAPQGVDDTSAKSVGLVPVMVIPLTVNAELPVFVKVAIFAGLVDPTLRAPKSKFRGTSFTEPEETVIVAARDFVESEIEVAVRVTAPPEGTLFGAV